MYFIVSFAGVLTIFYFARETGPQKLHTGISTQLRAPKRSVTYNARKICRLHPFLWICSSNNCLRW